MSYTYQPDLGLPEPASADRLSIHELVGCFPWDLLARIAPDYEAARRQYYRDNRTLGGRLGRCPKRARGFKECVAGLFRGLFLAGGSPAEGLAGLEEEENPSGAGAKGIPFLPQLKAWLIVSSNIEAGVLDYEGTLVADTTFTADFATLDKAPQECRQCASPCSVPEKACELTGIVAKSNSGKRPGLKTVAFVTPRSELPLDAAVLHGATHESLTLHGRPAKPS